MKWSMKRVNDSWKMCWFRHWKLYQWRYLLSYQSWWHKDFNCAHEKNQGSIHITGFLASIIIKATQVWLQAVQFSRGRSLKTCTLGQILSGSTWFWHDNDNYLTRKHLHMVVLLCSTNSHVLKRKVQHSKHTMYLIRRCMSVIISNECH